MAVAAGVSYAVVASVEAGRRKDAELAALQLSYVADMASAHQEWENFDLPRAVQILERYRPQGDKPDVRGYEWHLLWRMCQDVVHDLPQHDSATYLCSFSPDGRMLAVACADRTVRIWEVASKQPLQVLRGHAHEVNGVAFSPTGSWLASASDDGTLKLWNTSTWAVETTLDARQRPYLDVGFSPNGRWLAASGHDNEITVWDMSTRKALGSVFGHAFAFAPNEDRLATGREGQLWQYELPTLRETTAMEDVPFSVDSLLYMGHGKRLLVGTGDGMLRQWTMPDGRRTSTMNRVNKAGLEWMDRSPDGRFIATTSDEEGVRILNAGNMALRVHLKGFTTGSWCVAFSPTGRLLAATDDHGNVRLYGSQSLTPSRVLHQTASAITALAVAPAGDRMMLGTGGTIYIVSPTGTLLAESHAHASLPLGDFCGADYSPDGTRLVTGAHDSTVRLWAAPDLKELNAWHTNGRIGCVKFDASGQLLAWCGGTNLDFSDLRERVSGVW